MGLPLSPAYLQQIINRVNTPSTIIELALDSGLRKWGTHRGGMPDVIPILKSPKSLQNKLDVKSGYSTSGQLTITITGRENFKDLIKDEHLKNRTVRRLDGFVATGFQYSDYAETFTGKILDWDRKGDRLTLVIGDDLLVKGQTRLPVENVTKTQYLNYQNMNPADIMLDVLQNHLNIPSAQINIAQFETERDLWLSGFLVDRVLTKPEQANKILNELQVETNSFIFHDGQQISFKVMAPTIPGQTVEEWTDAKHILKDSLRVKGGYRDNFFTRIVVYFDYDESGDKNTENFESAYETFDETAESSAVWDESKTKIIKSKFLRSFTYTQPVNVTGVQIYRVSFDNGENAGKDWSTIFYDFTNNTLQWRAPDGFDGYGPAVKMNKSGTYQLFDLDGTKYIRVVVDVTALPGSDQTDTIDITSLNASILVKAYAGRKLTQLRDPLASINFKVGLNNVAYKSNFVVPTDLKDITTDDAFDKDRAFWDKERCLLTSVRPDYKSNVVDISAIQTRIPPVSSNKYAFITPTGFPDYADADSSQREFGYIGRTSDNKVFDGVNYVPGNLII